MRVAAIGGLTTNAELAQALQAFAKDPNISESHVSRWRKENALFNSACANALATANTIIANKAYEAARDGDSTMIKFWLERRSPSFMPKSKTTFEGAETLGDTLARRSIPEDELRRAGVLKGEGDDD